MILLANILLALAKIVELASVIISWVNADPYNPIVNFIYRVTEPALRKIRRYMPNTGMLDLSPLVLFVLIYLVQIVVFDTAFTYLMLLSNQMKGQAL